MTLNRGPSAEPDERPFVRCHGCDRLLKCYRGPLLRIVTNERGTWELYLWLCSECFSEQVAEALRRT